jgi:formate-dependent phosphoribosylglycinamide formyltransferase (GAR transformylase)
VNLIRREQAIRGHSEYRRHARAVLGHFVPRIAGANAAIERSINTLRHAAGAREKSVANALESGKCGGLEHFDSDTFATTE